MEEKLLFDEVVLNYEKRRPNYGTQLFTDIINYAGINDSKSIIEVGCGTGQATEPFLKAKCKVKAVEVGKNLAEFTKQKYKDYDNFEVINLAFEDYLCDFNSVDMLFSATAFHWIPAEIGYKKAYDILKNGGTIALFWNKPSVNRPGNVLHQKIQDIYDTYLPEWKYKRSNPDDTSRYISIQNTISSYGFTDIQFKLYYNTRILNSEEYIELLNTYSDHRALDEKIRIPFFEAIKAVIEEFDNNLTIYDTVDLYLAKKPC